jgi:crossover junction endodeoxyribonuclease RuvC
LESTRASPVRSRFGATGNGRCSTCRSSATPSAHEINGPALCAWLREHRPDHAFVEYAAARPGQGVSSTFKFGVTYGAMKMALAACGVAYTVVTSAKWKSAVGIQTGADKEQSRLRALQLFPDQAASLARKKNHARADSMLLAYYGLQLQKYETPATAIQFLESR